MLMSFLSHLLDRFPFRIRIGDSSSLSNMQVSDYKGIVLIYRIIYIYIIYIYLDNYGKHNGFDSYILQSSDSCAMDTEICCHHH